MEIKDITKIFIIESPSLNDVKVDRREGFALSEILRLSNIQNSYINVDSIATFSEALKNISDEIKKDIKKYGAITLHFSMHGNEEGIGLTNGDFIDWQKLYSIIKEFNDLIGYYITLPNGKILAPLNLHFSVCKGFYAIAIKKLGVETPYQTLVAPTDTVNWADSIMAFSIYYHSTLHKTNGSKVALQKMNFINDFDNVFQIDLMEDLILL